MAEYVRIFTVTNVAQIHLRFNDLVKAADRLDAIRRTAGLSPIASALTRDVLLLYREYNSSLDLIARQTADQSMVEMRRILASKRKRPRQGLRQVQLRDLIVSRPVKPFGNIATGQVGIADIGKLNMAINPMYPQYGTFWKTQEYGYPQMVGREVRGYFFDRGFSPSVPNVARFREDPFFISTRALVAAYGGVGFNDPGASSKQGPRGGRGALMTIHNAIEAKHFVEGGRAAAWASYEVKMRSLEDNTVRRLQLALGGAGVSP